MIKDGKIQPFQELQKRLGRKKVSSAILSEQPAGFIAYDCLEFQGEDIRSRPLSERRKLLEQVLTPILNSQFKISEVMKITDLEDLEKKRSEAREQVAEGLMLKAWQSPYSVGRKTGSWQIRVRRRCELPPRCCH